jgi:hypothetical protein
MIETRSRPVIAMLRRCGLRARNGIPEFQQQASPSRDIAASMTEMSRGIKLEIAG